MALTKVSKNMALITPIATADITDAAVTTAKIAAGAVITVDIADLAVTTEKLAATLNLSAKTVTLPNLSVTASKLAPVLDLTGKTVTLATTAIPDNSISSGKILDAGVTNAKLAINSVSTDKIQDSAVGFAKLATDARARIASAYGQVSATGALTGGLNVASVSVASNVFTVTLNANVVTANSIIIANIAPPQATGTTIVGAIVRCSGVTVASNIVTFATSTAAIATAHPFHFFII